LLSHFRVSPKPIRSSIQSSLRLLRRKKKTPIRASRMTAMVIMNGQPVKSILLVLS
jgi:hypothetical protein